MRALPCKIFPSAQLVRKTSKKRTAPSEKSITENIWVLAEPQMSGACLRTFGERRLPRAHQAFAFLLNEKSAESRTLTEYPSRSESTLCNPRRESGRKSSRDSLGGPLRHSSGQSPHQLHALYQCTISLGGCIASIEQTSATGLAVTICETVTACV